MFRQVAEAVVLLLRDAGIAAQVYEYNYISPFDGIHEIRCGVQVWDPAHGGIVLGITGVAPFDWQTVIRKELERS
jgi:hypothetical protein